MSVNNKLIDIEKLSRYHENLKDVLNTKEAAGEAAKAEAAAKKYADEEIAKLSFDEAGAAGEAYEAAKDYADDLVKNEDGSVKFDDKGAAAAAQAAAEATAAADATSKANAAQAAAEATAKAYVNGIVDDVTGDDGVVTKGLNSRIAVLEAIDHEKLASDASAAAVAAIVAGADSDFDTLREVADWIANDKDGAAALQIAVSEHGEAIEGLTNDKQDNITDLETIRTGAAAGAVAEQNAKDFATGLVMDGDKARFDAAGSAETAAAQALADAKADAADLYQEKGDYLIPSDLVFATDVDIDNLFA